MTYKIAVVGATGAVGREMLQTLHERKFPIDKVYALASSKSPGRQVSFGDELTIDVEPIEKFDFSKVDFAFLVLADLYLRNMHQLLENLVL